MSAEHLENPTQYGVGQQARLLDGVYAQAANVELVADPDPSGDPTQVVFKLRSAGLSSPSVLRYVLGAPRVKVGLMGHIYMPTLPDSILRIPEPFSWRDGSNNIIICVQVSTTGSLIVRATADESGPVLAETAGPVVTANGKWHIEAWAEFDVTGCDFELRVEGVTKISANLPTVTAPTCAQVAFSSLKTSNFVSDIDLYMSDIMINNGLGTYNSTFVGSLTMFARDIVSDVSLNWTPSTGTTGYTILDNTPANDAEYLSADLTPPPAYIGGIENLPSDITSIRAVMTQVRARKVDGGDGNLQVGIVTGAMTAQGADRPITSAMTYWRDISEEDPNTSAPYIPAAFDASNFTMNRTV